MARIVLGENLKVSRKRLAKILRESGHEIVKSIDEPFDWYVKSQALPDIHPSILAFKEKKQGTLLDEYELYARIWNADLLANLLEDRMESDLWNRKICLVGDFSTGETKKIESVLKSHFCSLTENPAEASLFLLGHRAYGANPKKFESMLRQKAKRPYVKILGRPAFAKLAEKTPPPHKKQKGQEKGRLYFGKPNPVSCPESYVALDLEATSDRNSNKVIEIGMVRVKNGVETDSFQSFVNPHERLKPVIVDLTGINDAMLKDAPDIQGLQKDILNFVGEDPVVGHSVQNDMKLLADNLNMPMSNNYVDTCKMALVLMPEREKFSLSSLAQDYGLAKNTHRALDDARTSHELLEKFRELFF